MIGLDGSPQALEVARHVAGRDWPAGTCVHLLSVVDVHLSAVRPIRGDASPLQMLQDQANRAADLAWQFLLMTNWAIKLGSILLLAVLLAIPIRLRDEVIGVINICMPNKHAWDPDEQDVAEAVAERLSIAIETSLLIETTRRRAEIERVTSEISGKISSTTQFEAILRTAAEELSRALGGSEVVVQLQSPDLSFPEQN